MSSVTHETEGSVAMETTVSLAFHNLGSKEMEKNSPLSANS